LVGNDVTDYSKNRVERGIPLHLSKREACFGDKKSGISDGIGNLLDHLPLLKKYIFSIGDWNE